MKQIHSTLTVLFVWLFCVCAQGALAQNFDELRFGGTWAQPQWLDTGHTEADQVGVNAEILFSPVFIGTKNAANSEHNSFMTGILNPRPHLGFMVNFSDNGTSYAYGGLTWQWALSDLFFVELGFGLGANNGNITATPTRAGLGSHLLFHEIFALGMNLNESWTAVFQLEHLSHAELFHDSNRGLSNASMKLGYKF